MLYVLLFNILLSLRVAGGSEAIWKSVRDRSGIVLVVTEASRISLGWGGWSASCLSRYEIWVGQFASHCCRLEGQYKPKMLFVLSLLSVIRSRTCGSPDIKLLQSLSQAGNTRRWVRVSRALSTDRILQTGDLALGLSQLLIGTDGRVVLITIYTLRQEDSRPFSESFLLFWQFSTSICRQQLEIDTIMKK